MMLDSINKLAHVACIIGKRNINNNIADKCGNNELIRRAIKYRAEVIEH